MTADLSICQPLIDRDPVLYLDLTEAVRRGDGRVLGAGPCGALVAFHGLTDGTDLGYTMFASDRRTAESLCRLLPPDPGFVTVHETLYFDLLEKRFGFSGMEPCWQMGYLHISPLPLPELGLEVRRLDPSCLPIVTAHYEMEGPEYLGRLIERGELYGAFEGDTLTGFIGRHAEGSIGILEVLPPYRRRGIATLLQSHMINLELSRGRIPYGQVFDGNEPSLALQRSLGMTRSQGQLYWATRDD